MAAAAAAEWNSPVDASRAHVHSLHELATTGARRLRQLCESSYHHELCHFLWSAYRLLRQEAAAAADADGLGQLRSELCAMRLLASEGSIIYETVPTTPWTIAQLAWVVQCLLPHQAAVDNAADIYWPQWVEARLLIAHPVHVPIDGYSRALMQQALMHLAECWTTHVRDHESTLALVRVYEARIAVLLTRGGGDDDVDADSVHEFVAFTELVVRETRRRLMAHRLFERRELPPDAAPSAHFLEWWRITADAYQSTDFWTDMRNTLMRWFEPIGMREWSCRANRAERKSRFALIAKMHGYGRAVHLRRSLGDWLRGCDQYGASSMYGQLVVLRIFSMYIQASGVQFVENYILLETNEGLERLIAHNDALRIQCARDGVPRIVANLNGFDVLYRNCYISTRYAIAAIHEWLRIVRVDLQSHVDGIDLSDIIVAASAAAQDAADI